MNDLAPIVKTVAEMRNAFDQTYALPLSASETAQSENLLVFRLAGDPYAIRTREIKGLASDRKIIALPTSIPELLGLAGIRGELVPVYSLAALLGYMRDANQPRWLALCGEEKPIGISFNHLDGYIRFPSAQICPSRQQITPQGLIQDVARTDDEVRSIVNIPSVMEAIRRRCSDNRASIQ